MAFDYFNFSPSYLKRMGGRPETLESRRVIIAEASEDDYMIPEEKIPALIEKLKKKGLPNSKGKIFDTCMLYRRTKKALMGDKKEKDFLHNINSGRHWVAIPYECFLEDNLVHWEKVLELIEKEAVPEKKTFVLIPERRSVVHEEIVVTTKEDGSDDDEIARRLRAIENMGRELSLEAAGIRGEYVNFLDSYWETKDELSECLDNLHSTNGKEREIKLLKDVLEQKKTELETSKKEWGIFKEEAIKLNKENDVLREDNELLRMELEEAHKNSSNLVEKIRFLEEKVAGLGGNVIEQIRALVSPALPTSSILHVSQPITIHQEENGEEKRKTEYWENRLPTVYTPTNGAVRFNKSFLTALERAEKYVLDMTINAIINICQNGITKVSLNRKTMNMPSSSGISPASCTQIKVLKKFRFTLKVCGSDIEFYEFYSRDKSPFCGGSKKIAITG